MLWTIESHSKEFKGEKGERKGEFNYPFPFQFPENSEIFGNKSHTESEVGERPVIVSLGELSKKSLKTVKLD
jgi:hypothetical protein